MRVYLRSAAAILLALVTAGSLRAQTMELGVKGGWVRPTFGGSDAQGADARSTFGGGGFLALQLTPLLALQPELLYLNKGAEDTEQGMTVAFRLGYIEVPILARLTFPIEGSRIRPHVFAGPAVGFRSKCDINVSSGTVSMTAACDDPTLDVPLKKTDWSIAGGAGVAFPLGRVNALLEARYDYGLTKLDDSAAAADLRNRAFMLFAGVSLPVGKLGAVATERTR